MAISLRVKEEEAALIRDYARMNGQSVSEFIRSTVMERIEDEIDIQLYKEAMEEYRKDPTTYSQEEVERMLIADEDV